jgi:trehalose synthase
MRVPWLFVHLVVVGRGWRMEPKAVTVPRLAIEPFRALVGDERFDRLLDTARQAQGALAGRAVLTVNSTAVGGGVAEMLQRLVGYDRGLGLDARWSVIAGEGDFFRVTKRIHHFLHGQPGDGGPLGRHERAVYRSVIGRNAEALVGQVRSGDIVHLHDPQVVGLAPALAGAGARVVWQLHIGADGNDGELAAQAWKFLEPDLAAVDVFVFTREAYVPAHLADRQVRIIPPSIDPFSVKNIALDNACAILRHVGVLADRGPDDHPVFTRHDGSRGRVDRCPDLLTEGPPSADVPLVVQVSRWDPLKDMAGVMAGFALVGRPDAHLALIGPETGSVDDDPESRGVYEACVRQWHALSDDVRRRVHLVALPMADPEENAAMVNAVQRHAAVVVQKSLAEGFGLTVTEAMWKARPVVASAVGGIRDQITDGVHGLLVADPADPACMAAALEKMLADPDGAERMGAAAKERVLAEYLDDRHLRQRLTLYAGLAAVQPA